jgi:hypothetical protein
MLQVARGGERVGVMSVEAVPRPRIIQGMWARMDASCNGHKTVRLPSSQWLAA